MCKCGQQNEEVTLLMRDGLLHIVHTETGKTFGCIEVYYCPMCGEEFKFNMIKHIPD